MGPQERAPIAASPVSASSDSAPSIPVPPIAEGFRAWAIVFLVALLPHVAAPSFDFVMLDDDALILDNTETLSDSANIPALFGQHMFAARANEEATYYRPIVILSYLFDWQRAGPRPGTYHWTNVWLHVGASLLLLRFLLRLGAARGAALLASVFFAAHPFASSVVAWIPGRNDSLLAVFSLGSALAYLRLVERPGAGALALHGILFAAAMFTKEAAIVLPVLFVGLRVLAVRSGAIAPAPATTAPATTAPAGTAPAGMSRAGTGKPSLLELAAYGVQLAVLVVWFVARSAVVEGVDPGFMVRSILANLAVVPQYVAKTFFPHDLSTYPVARDRPTLPGWIAVGGLVGFGVFAAVAAGRSFQGSSRSEARGEGRVEDAVEGSGEGAGAASSAAVEPTRTRLGLLFGAVWFAAFLLPTLVIAEPWDSALLFEHRMYVPMIGLLAGLAFAAPVAVFAASTARLASASAVVAVGLGTVTFLHDRDWSGPEAVWRSAVATSPSSAVAHLFLGIRHGQAGDLDAAERQFEAARELDPELPQLGFNLGVLASDRGNLEEAIAHFERELEIDPTHAGAASRIGRTWLALDRPEPAIAAFERALEIDPGHFEALEFLAMIRCRQGDAAAARALVERMRRRGGALSDNGRRVLAPCLSR